MANQPNKVGPWKRHRALLGTLIAGLFLAGVPTYYSVFVNRATKDPLWLRLIIFVAWSLIGLYVLWRAWGRDQTIEKAMGERREVQKAVRTSATADVLDALTQPGVMGLPASYEMTLYLYDAEKNSLEPYFPHLHLPAGQEDPRRFDPGRGATGRAWQEGYLFYVRGEAVANDKFNLTEPQRQFFKDYRSVASTPIRDDQGTQFGVLTVLSREDDGFFESGAAGQGLLRNIADTFGVVLTSVPDPEDLVSSQR